MKQFLQRMLFLLALTCVSHGIWAYDFEVDGIYYTITSSTDLTVSVTYGASSSNSYSGDIVIPSTVEHDSNVYSVTGITSYAFKSCSSLKSITLPNSITTLGQYAFFGCYNLTSISIPASVTSIADYVFEGCTGLEDLRFEDGEQTLNIGSGSNAHMFYNCHLNNVYIGRDLSYTYLPFCQNTYVKSVEIAKDWSSIPNSFFYGCTSLEEVKISETITDLGTEAFYNCHNLKSISLPNSIITIGQNAFYGCSNLKSLVIPKSVTTIGTYAFYNCPLRSVTFGTGLLSIGSKAFNSVIKAIWLTNTPPSGYANVTSTINFVANDQYTSLSNQKQYNFLSSSFIVDGIKYVPTSMSGRTCDVIDCEYTNAAQNVAINSSVTYRNVAFNVENINDYACYDNDSIQSLTIGEDAPAISNYAFYDCNNITTATLKEGTPGICSYAFSGCTKLGAISIPNSVTTLGTCAFQNCTSLTSATIGSGLTSVPTYAFSCCTSLPSITIPENVTSVGNYAYTGCTAIKDVLINNRETSLKLGSNGSSPLFASCPLDSVYIGGQISYSYSPFYRNTTLRSIVIADTETSIYTDEFYGCTGLKNVTIGDGVTSIGDWAFSGCSSLDHFIFGTALETIGKEAFSDCTAITEITTRCTTPPVCGDQALDDISKWDCTLRIPTESVEEYTAADQWKEFLFTEGLSADVHTLTYNLDGKLYELDYFTHGTVIIPPTAPEREGYTFNGWENIPSYMPDANLVINGSYTVNNYKLTYYLDGEVYKESDVDYGTQLTALADPTKEGWYYFSGWNEVPATMPAYDVNVYGTLNPYVLGDVNNDNSVSVSDAVGIANLILNTNTDGLIRAAADLNGDKTVSVADMIYECNVILGNNTITAPSSAKSRNSIEARSNARLEVNDVTLSRNGDNALYISLNNPYDEITGLQFDLYLPEGIRIAQVESEYDGTVSDITLAGRTSYNNHALSNAPQQDGSVRVLLSSNALKTINGTEGRLIKIRLTSDDAQLADGSITIDNIELGKTDNSYIHQDAVTANISSDSATSIQNIANSSNANGTYDLNGRKVSDNARGIVISNGKKVVRK